MSMQVHKHIASVKRVPFRTYMERLLRQHECRCLSHPQPITLIHATFLQGLTLSNSIMLIILCHRQHSLVPIQSLGSIDSGFVFPAPNRSANEVQRNNGIHVDCSFQAWWEVP